MIDPYFKVELIARTDRPQTVIYLALHQDYSEEFVMSDLDGIPSEFVAGQIAVDRLLKGGRGHFGCLEHPQITLNCGWFPHSTMQQMRTHRVGVSFDVQSGRYSGQRIAEVALGKRTVEEVFYLRPVGEYCDRSGKRYEYTEMHRLMDIDWCLHHAERYADLIAEGFSEEHARGLIPFDVRQHWVMSANVRSMMHLLDLRWKADAQLECQHLCDLMWEPFKEWVPEIANWYEENRAKKARLAP